MLAPVAGLGLDRLADGDALDHLPFQARGAAILHRRQLGLPARDFGGRPDSTGRDVMQGGDHALNAGLQHGVNGNRILGTKPAPGVPHFVVLSFIR